MREPRAPGARLGAGLKTCGGPNPRGRGPLCIVGFYDNGGEILLKREPTGSLGSGGTPAAFLLPFVAEDKRKWPRIGRYFCQNCVLYARTNHEAVFLYALMPRGTPFLDVKKGGERSVRGHCPLNPRAALSIFFSGKSTMTMLPKSARTMRGPEAPGVRLGAGLKQYSGPKPWAEALYVSPVRAAAGMEQPPLLFIRLGIWQA